VLNTLNTDVLHTVAIRMMTHMVTLLLCLHFWLFANNTASTFSLATV